MYASVSPVVRATCLLLWCVCVCVWMSHIQHSKWWGSKDCHCVYCESWSDIVSFTKAQILACKRIVLRVTVRGTYNVFYSNSWKVDICALHTFKVNTKGPCPGPSYKMSKSWQFAFIFILKHLSLPDTNTDKHTLNHNLTWMYVQTAMKPRDDHKDTIKRWIGAEKWFRSNWPK